MTKWLALMLGALFLWMSTSTPTLAKVLRVWKIKGPYRIELDVLPAEPFCIAPPTSSPQIPAGMVAIAGAAPLAMDAPSHPNHHLVVHVFDQKTGQVETHARVHLSLSHLNAQGQPVGTTLKIPVVVMEVVGMGSNSTHYGNNVHIAPGSYRVTVVVNNETLHFKIKT